MKLSHTNIALAIALAVVVAMSAMMQVDYSRPNFEMAFPAMMTRSPAYGAYAPNENFADGRTLQSPVAGTIARGASPLHFEATPEDAVRAGEQLVSSYEPASEEALASSERGTAVFAAFCVACHGGGGAGDGLVTKRGFPPPPSLLTGKSLEMKDGQLYHILTYGQGSMPQFAAQLSPDQRWDIINYIRSLQQQAAPADEPADEPAPDAAEGTDAPEATDAPEGTEAPDEEKASPDEADEADEKESETTADGELESADTPDAPPGEDERKSTDAEAPPAEGVESQP